MNQPLDELFFIWLVGQVTETDTNDPSQTHLKLLKQLYTKEFVSIIPNDENRLEDGKDLRRYFIDDENPPRVDDEWMQMGCSFLELTLGLARQLSFEAEGEAHYWFWRLIGNLGLKRYTDDRRLMKSRINGILDVVINREYDPDGYGGFFPLEHPRQDQRKVELWYQLSAYVMELD